MDKRIITGLLGIGVLALFGTDAMAATCALKSSSGTCLYYTKGVIGDLVTDNNAIGSGKKAKFVLDVHPTGSGIVTCGNPGKNGKPASGIQIVFLPDFAAFFGDATSGDLPITKGDISSATAEIITPPLSYPLLVSSDLICPNAGWIVLDAVACDTSNAVQLKSITDSSIIETATEACTLNTTPDACQTVGINPKGVFDTRQYDCLPAVITTP
jgi:hypothetical protein